MIFRVSDVLEEIAPFVDGAGVDAACEPGRSKAMAALNRATRQLMNEGDWPGAEAEICIPVHDCCLTLDERFETIRTANQRRGAPLSILGQGFKYLEGGMGALDCCGSECLSMMEDLGDGHALHRDLPRAMPVLAFSDRHEAADACLEMRGTDANGKELLSAIPIRHSHGADRAPAYSAPAPDHWSTGRWSRLVELRKPKTEGYVYVYGYEPATGEMCWLSSLQPDTLSPSHRRYRVPGGNGACPKEIIAKVSLRWRKLLRGDDVSLIQNPDALARMVQALAALDAGDAGRYEFYKNSAISQLRKQIARRDRPAKTGLQVRMGRAPLAGRDYSGRGFGMGRIVSVPGQRTVVMVENTKIERIPGTPGRDGRDGETTVPWQPVYAIVPDGSRRVMKIVDWFGGIDPKPETGQYLGPNGYVSAIGDATDIRGEGGGGSLGTFTASIELAGHRWVNVDSSGQLRYADAALLREAHGLIVQSVAAGQPVEVFNGGKFAGFAGLTGGGSLYLSTTGQQSHTAPVSGLSQQVAVAKDADEIFIDIEEPTEL